ncbi:MAG: hypothetical protein K9J24_16225 [Bacteroidales bacterium]|nr:hypothetical protein [Bacteroidales bacterium]
MKLLKGTQLFILAALIALPLSLLFSSCSGSDDCYYSASRYQKKRKRDGSNLHYRPSSFKHDSPVKKKWIIDKKRKPIIK